MSNHDDDLVMKYQTASTEQPSRQTDQLILQAAADALKNAPDDKTVNPSQAKVIKGNFSTRRWHMPVSIAAAALITVSVVSSLKPWSVSVPKSIPSNEVTDETVSDEVGSMDYEFNSAAETIAKPDAVPGPSVNAEPGFSIEARQQPTEKKADTVTDKMYLKEKQEVLTMSSEPSRQKAAAPKSGKRKKVKNVFSEAQQNTDDIDYIQTTPAKTKVQFLDTNQWLTTIEQHITDNKIDTAREKLAALLNKQSLENFTKEELERLKIIQQQLKLSVSTKTPDN